MSPRTALPTCTWDGHQWSQPDGSSCAEAHCAMRGRCPNHVQPEAGVRTCGACIGRTRKDLAAIVLLHTLVRYDAQADGVDSEAMNLIARAAAPEQYAVRRDQLTARYQRQGWCHWPRLEAYATDDPHHPYAVLSRWDQALRDHGYLGQTDLLFTVARGAVDLDAALNGSFPHGDEFEAFAGEIAACRSHLEAVDHDARIAELGRPCPTCATELGTGPRLRKRYAKHPGYRPGQRCERAECPTCDGTNDAWHCPDNPAHAWTEAEYRLRVDADYVSHADRLTADQLAERFGIKAGTVWVWAARGHVRRRGKDHRGRQLYDVADTQERVSIAAAAEVV